MDIMDLTEEYCGTHVEVMKNVCESMRLERDGYDILAENLMADSLFALNKMTDSMAKFMNSKIDPLLFRHRDKRINKVTSKLDDILSSNPDIASELKNSNIELKIWKCDLDYTKAIKVYREDMADTNIKAKRAQKRFAETLLKTTKLSIHDDVTIENILVTYEHAKVKVTAANIHVASKSVVDGYRSSIDLLKTVIEDLQKIRKETKKDKESFLLGMRKLNQMIYCMNLIYKTSQAMYLAEAQFLTTLKQITKVIKKSAKKNFIDVEDIQDVIDEQLTYAKIKETERAMQAYAAGAYAGYGAGYGSGYSSAQ